MNIKKMCIENFCFRAFRRKAPLNRCFKSRIAYALTGNTDYGEVKNTEMSRKKQGAKQKKQGAPIVRGLVRPMPGGRTAPGRMGIGIDNDSIGRDVLLSDTDPDGSYTGIAKDCNEKPVQDADDL